MKMKMKRILNNNLAIVASQLFKEAVHDTLVMICLEQASGHGQSAAVITDMLWELGVTSLGRC